MGCCASRERDAYTTKDPSRALKRRTADHPAHLDDPFGDLGGLDEDATAEEERHWEQRTGRTLDPSKRSRRRGSDDEGEEERFYRARGTDDARGEAGRSAVVNPARERKRDPRRRVTGLVSDADTLGDADREVVRRLLDNLVSPESRVWARVEELADEGRGSAIESRVELDNTERLLVLGLAGGAREIPYKDVVHARLDDADPRCVVVEIRGEGTPLLRFGGADPQDEAADFLDMVDALIDRVNEFSYPLVHFGVLRRQGDGSYQPRLLQVDLPNRLVSNLHRGELRTEFHFTQISGVRPHGNTGLSLTLRDFEPYEYVAQTPPEREVLLRVLHEISTQRFPTHRLTGPDLAVLPFWPRTPAKTSYMEKGAARGSEGAKKWSRRWVALVGGHLFVFRDDRSATPTEVVTLLGGSVGAEADLVLAVTTEHAESVFRCTTVQERDAWCEAIDNASQAIRKGFKDYERIFLERERVRKLHDA